MGMLYAILPGTYKVAKLPTISRSQQNPEYVGSEFVGAANSTYKTVSNYSI